MLNKILIIYTNTDKYTGVIEHFISHCQITMVEHETQNCMNCCHNYPPLS